MIADGQRFDSGSAALLHDKGETAGFGSLKDLIEKRHERLFALLKSGDAFEVLARNDLNDRIMASPAIAENTLYVRSARQLWAFGRKQP